jgi:hypothetical protein
MDAIARLCTKCFYLVKGQLQMTGTPSEAIKAYSDYSKSVSSEIDLATLPRTFEGSPDARLLKLRTLQTSQAAWCFEYGAPLEFSVEFSVAKPLDAPEIGFYIFSITGIQLASTTTAQENKVERLQPGRYSMIIRIPDFFLNPGTYTLGLGIVVAERHVDTIATTAQIEILPNAASIQKQLNRIWSPLTPHAVFEINRL